MSCRLQIMIGLEQPRPRLSDMQVAAVQSRCTRVAPVLLSMEREA